MPLESDLSMMGRDVGGRGLKLELNDDRSIGPGRR